MDTQLRSGHLLPEALPFEHLLPAHGGRFPLPAHRLPDCDVIALRPFSGLGADIVFRVNVHLEQVRRLLVVLPGKKLNFQEKLTVV